MAGSGTASGWACVSGTYVRIRAVEHDGAAFRGEAFGLGDVQKPKGIELPPGSWDFMLVMSLSTPVIRFQESAYAKIKAVECWLVLDILPFFISNQLVIQLMQ